jgi:hypothetical protein
LLPQRIAGGHQLGAQERDGVGIRLLQQLPLELAILRCVVLLELWIVKGRGVEPVGGGCSAAAKQHS